MDTTSLETIVNMSVLDNITTTLAYEEEQGGSQNYYSGSVGVARSILVAFQGPTYLLTAAFGSVTNIINMIVFYRQGILTDSCTPSLFGLALSDFCCTFNLFICQSLNIRENIGLIQWETDKYLIAHLQAIAWTIGTPVRMYSEISSWITVYLSVERMISVSYPFHVKRILTPKRSCAIIGLIWLYGFLIYLSNLLEGKLIWKSYVNGTVTILRNVATGIISYDVFETFSLVRDGPFRLARIVTVAICNVIIIVKVRKSKKFKETNTKQKAPDQDGIKKNDELQTISNSNTSKQENQRETKLMRMIVVLTSVYIICYFPANVKQVLLYIDTYAVTFGFWFVPYWGMDMFSDYFEFLNTTVNIIVYYTMSSRYKEELRKLCSCCRR